MTLLTKIITRELPGTFDRRQWVTEFHPWGIRFRAKRTRKFFDITWDAIWNKAMMIEVARVRVEKLAARKAKRAS